MATDPSALDRFWSEVRQQGAPLVEPVVDAPGVVLVTFLWQETGPTDNVLLVEWISGLDFRDRLYTKVPNTDLWYRSMRMRDNVRTSYSVAPNDSLLSRSEEKDWPTRMAGWVTDPLNPLHVVEEKFHGMPSDFGRYSESLLSLPNAAPEPWIEHDPGVPAGVVDHHQFTSATLDNIRDVWVYTPPGYAEMEQPLPVMILFDGEKHDAVMRVQTVLDNTIAAGLIPPLVALMIGNVDRGTELPCSVPFATSVAEEMVPWLSKHYRVTNDRNLRVVAGQSYGGLAAAWCGLTHPELFGNVLSQSGSYWWKPDPGNDLSPVEMGDAPEWGWLPAQVAAWPVQPVRFWMEVGRLENMPHGDTPGMVACNRHMRDVLLARGYRVEYREYAGGHDYVWWRSTLAEGLTALLGDDSPELETS